MANSCNFVMKLNGKTKNVEEMINFIVRDALEVNEDRYFEGWLKNIKFEIEDDLIDGTSVAFVTGECKWSVIVSLLGVENSYYYDSKKKFGGELNVTCIEIESKRYDLDIEIYSSEYDAGFEEHYLIKKGELLIKECLKAWQLDRMYFEDEDLTDELKEIVEKFVGKKLSEQKWENVHKYLLENPRNYRLGGFDEWKFQI